MKTTIWGDILPAVTIDLEQGESIYTESGGMTWMSDKVKMDTNMKGGFMKGLGRMFSGESLFMATYTAEAPNQSITIASSFPGEIKELHISSDKEFICQKSAFLCAEQNVELSTYVTSGIKKGLFGGEGFVLQKLSGNGTAFIELDGSVKEIDLAAGEKLKVDTGSVAIFESTVKYDVETVKGFKNMLFGGEGLFLTTLTGPCKVYLQTMNMAEFANKIIPYLPTPSSK